MTTECVVVGAGVVGVSVALRLAQQGVQVTLVDAGAPGAGTTGTSGSLVGSNEKRPYDYYQLGLLGMAAMRRLAAELEHSSWFLPTGHLEWADSTATQEALDSRVAQLQEWAYPVSRLSPRQVVRNLEPELVIPPEVDEVTFFSDDSIVYPHVLLALMLRELTSLGARLCFGVGATTIESGPSGVQGVRLADRRMLSADVVISCLGRWTEQALAPLGVTLPLVSPWGRTPEALGFQVVTTAVVADVRRMIRMPGLSIRPAGGGRLMLHGRPEEVQLHAAGEGGGLVWDRPLCPPPPQADQLVEKARRIVPNAMSASVQSAVAAVRALPHDGQPVAGWIAGHPGLYAVVAHSGIGLGPLFGELVADEVRGGSAPVLSPFRPDRFTGEAWRTRPSPMRKTATPDAPTN